MPSTNPKKNKTRKVKPKETGEKPPENFRGDSVSNPNAKYACDWMRQWLDDASKKMDVLEACKEPDMPFVKYFNGRVACAQFDADCRTLEQVIDLRIIEQIRSESTADNNTARGLYFKEVRRPAFVPPFSSWNEPAEPPPPGKFPTKVADAMVYAGLVAYEALEDATKKTPPPDEGEDKAEKRGTKHTAAKR